MTTRNLLSSLVLLCLAGSLWAHPAFQHHFNKIVESNPCLRRCMDKATASGAELSLMKTANISAFLLNLENICSTISTAKDCISACGVDSNPFALESMTVICNEQSIFDAQAVAPCLEEHGEATVDKCTEECGDYDQLNDQVHSLTQAFKPDNHKPEEVTHIMDKIGQACSSLKCSDRCSIREFTQQCGSTEDGNNAGTVVQSLVQRVLDAQRRDLERMRLVDTLAHSTPVQCSYMYMPEVMFNPSKDKMAHSIVTGQQDRAVAPKEEPKHTDGTPNKSELSLALSQLQAHLLRKQMQLLDMQEKNLIKESHKLDLQMSLMQVLARKNFGPVMPSMVPRQYYRA